MRVAIVWTISIRSQNIFKINNNKPTCLDLPKDEINRYCKFTQVIWTWLAKSGVILSSLSSYCFHIEDWVSKQLFTKTKGTGNEAPRQLLSFAPTGPLGAGFYGRFYVKDIHIYHHAKHQLHNPILPWDDNEPSAQEKQQVKDQQPCIFFFVFV